MPALRGLVGTSVGRDQEGERPLPAVLLEGRVLLVATREAAAGDGARRPLPGDGGDAGGAPGGEPGGGPACAGAPRLTHAPRTPSSAVRTPDPRRGMSAPQEERP